MVDPLYARIKAEVPKWAKFARLTIFIETGVDPAEREAPRPVRSDTGVVGKLQTKPGIMMHYGIAKFSPEVEKAIRDYEKTRKYSKLYRAILKEWVKPNRFHEDEAQFMLFKAAAADYERVLQKNGISVTPATMYLLHHYGVGGGLRWARNEHKLAKARVSAIKPGAERFAE